MDPRRVRAVDADQLTDLQVAGVACVWCGTTVNRYARRHVGALGLPPRPLYGCLDCASSLRLPAWPEPGSA